ncbi:regulator of telomere elongation helicase 1-like isoform X2 [Halichondria panicea]|uniref:regulator of telomere elongation helicase 1-like isoform X2 n=1 Tax=Halichondria panicea TaxID=6063 RepID=UPI00312B5AA9
MTMETLTLNNVTVEFPFKPYPCQVVYMEKVITALQSSTNAILESPTGTGKTLCLLCAALAWRANFVQQLRGTGELGEGGVAGEEDPWDSVPGISSSVPKIIYASRTHSQLSQVVQELKNTIYRPKVAIIGSREQLCINSEVAKKESNAEKVHLCRAKVKAHACFYYNNTDVKRLRVEDPVMDIEDLVMAGTKQRMCPYYLARELKSQADIVFMPYNYILDIKTRQMHGVDLQGTIVILDEAHNIERVCEDSASFDLTSHDLAQCISDIGHILDLKQKGETYLEEGGTDVEDLQDFLNLKEFFLTLENTLDGIQFAETAKKEMVKPGGYIFDFLETAGVTRATASVLMDQCNKAISFLTTDERSGFRNGGNIQKFTDALKIVFSGSCDQPSSSAHQYKVFIKATEDTKKNKKSDGWGTLTQESSKRECRTLSYWCFSPGYAMSDLVSQGVRSVILTSGTLSPLNSFSSELQIDFPIRYEGPHVITKKQMWVGVVSKGSDGTSLNSSYANRFSASYQNSLGNTIVNFARIIPNGLLVFFPSYPVMNGCVDTWKGNGIFQRIESCKPVFQEPRRKFEFTSTMDAFYENVVGSKGAAFFAVCRGKVSEGLDFANENGRAVIITGLPYPPRMDPKVTLKMQYLQESLKRPAAVGISGEAWYKQQASRAVNQAVGRVIRHRHDYGAIILCDERFAYNSSINQLPQWIRPYVQTYDKFGLVQRDIRAFFKEAEKDFGGLVPQKKAPVVAEIESAVRSERPPPDIVIRDNLRHVQAASVVDIHIPGKIPPRPQASLARLKVESAKELAGKSLLSSLASCEGCSSKNAIDLTSTKGAYRSSFSQTIFQAGPSKAHATHDDGKPPAKKIMIVAKSDRQKTKLETVAGYLKELKASLSNEGFENFKIILKTYKEVSTDLLVRNTRQRSRRSTRSTQATLSPRQPQSRCR